MDDGTDRFSDDAMLAFAAWIDHTEQCEDGCSLTYSTTGADEHCCPQAVALLGVAITANTRALYAQHPVDPRDGEEDPRALVGQPWRAPVEVPA